MKFQFKCLTFIGTALLVATGSSAAFARTNRYNSACDYTPENRYCVGTNYQNRTMVNLETMNESMPSNRSQMNIPGSNRNMDTPVRNNDSRNYSPNKVNE